MREYETAEGNEELEKRIHDMAYDKCYAIAKQGTSKAERGNAFAEVKEEVKASFTEEEMEEFGHLSWRLLQKSRKRSCS